MRRFLSEYFHDLLDFGKSQLVVGATASLITLICLFWFGELTSRKSIQANLLALAVAYGALFLTFAVGNLIWTVFQADLRAYRAKERIREAEEVARIAAARVPSPNLTFSKIDLVRVIEEGRGLKASQGTTVQGIAMVAVFRNEILGAGDRIAPAKAVLAEVDYRLRRPSGTPTDESGSDKHVLVATWLGLGDSASLYPGDTASLVLLYAKSGGDLVAIETQHGVPLHVAIQPGVHDVLVTLRSRDPKAYVRRFHVIVDADGETASNICSDASCWLCTAHQLQRDRIE